MAFCELNRAWGARIRPVAQRGRERERQSEREYYQRERERDVRVLREGLVGQSRENGERERLVGQSREKKEEWRA